MEIKSISYGPLTTPSFYINKQYFEDVFNIERRSFLNRVKGEVSPKVFDYVKQLDLNFTNIICPLYTKYICDKTCEEKLPELIKGNLNFENLITQLEVIKDYVKIVNDSF